MLSLPGIFHVFSSNFPSAIDQTVIALQKCHVLSLPGIFHVFSSSFPSAIDQTVIAVQKCHVLSLPGIFDVFSSNFPTATDLTQQPQYYNPSSNTAPYNPAVSSPGGPYTGLPAPGPGPQGQFTSYQDRKAETAWNDPPAILEPKKSKEEHSVSYDVGVVG